MEKYKKKLLNFQPVYLKRDTFLVCVCVCNKVLLKYKGGRESF